MDLQKWLVLSALTLGGVTSIGCHRPDDQAVPTTDAATAGDDATLAGAAIGEPSVPSEAAEAKGGRDRRQAIASQAKDALFARLSGRLMAVLQSEGPAAAIDVCSQEAVEISEAVGREHGVQIGRTSFKLRNPANQPRRWVQPFVEQRVETSQRVELAEGSLGVLFPIHLKVKCLMCHGGEQDILPEVKAELAKRYPADQAIEFAEGELRGWFWVEVPEDGASESSERG
ncbi:MAG: DUF3365 domain-containing protein [Rubripirellula sp.]|nr:DUF3365 domain-containing protein [Rubripirellula sp.]